MDMELSFDQIRVNLSFDEREYFLNDTCNLVKLFLEYASNCVYPQDNVAFIETCDGQPRFTRIFAFKELCTDFVVGKIVRAWASRVFEAGYENNTFATATLSISDKEAWSVTIKQCEAGHVHTLSYTEVSIPG